MATDLNYVQFVCECLQGERANYIKDVVVRPEYQKLGLGKFVVSEVIDFIKTNAINGASIFIELCSRPDKVGFYKKLGFNENDGQSMKLKIKTE